MLDQLIIPLAHLFTAPGGYSALVNSFALIGDNQILINANHFTIPLTALTGPVWIVKAEKVGRRLFKTDTIQLKPVAKKTFCFIPVILFKTHIAIAFAFKKSSLYGVAQAT